MPQVGPGFLEQCFARGPCWCHVGGSGGAPHSAWPLAFDTPLPLAWQRPSSSVQSVNEVEDLGGMVDGRHIRRGCQCVKGCWLCGGGFLPRTQEVGCVVVVGCGRMSLMSLCAFWCCSGCAVLVALLTFSGRFMENGCPWETGLCFCGCVLAPPFWSSFRSIQCNKCTLLALTATPLLRTCLNESGWVSFTGCLSCGLQGHLSSFTHLVSLAS